LALLGTNGRGSADTARPENDGQRRQKARGLEFDGLENDGQSHSRISGSVFFQTPKFCYDFVRHFQVVHFQSPLPPLRQFDVRVTLQVTELISNMHAECSIASLQLKKIALLDRETSTFFYSVLAPASDRFILTAFVVKFFFIELLSK